MSGRPLTLRDEDLDWRELEGEVVVLDLRGSEYFAVNAAGSAVWQALADGATREELIAALQERYDLDDERAGGDVDAFLADLERRGLLVSP